MKFRSEIKYLITNNDFMLLNYKLNNFLTKDKHCKSTSYKISSLYFDDYKNSAYYQVVNGISERWKYRIRFYNNDSSLIKLEKKYKKNGLTLKTSVNIDYELFNNILNRNVKVSNNFKPLLNEFILKINKDLLRPVIFIEYDRIPYVYKLGNVRITLDYNIGYTKKFTNLFNDKRLYYLEDKVLEVKYNEFLPSFIKTKLGLSHLERTSFSKFKNCVERSRIC